MTEHTRHDRTDVECLTRLLALLASTDLRVVGDHAWPEALVQHCLQELQGTLRQRTFSRAVIEAL